MSRRIFYDGLNLSLEHGTGIATYTRTLARIARDLGYEVGAVYSSPHRPAETPLLREISFFDPNYAARISRRRGTYNYLTDQISYMSGVRPHPLDLSGAVIADEFNNRLLLRDQVFVSRNLFTNARLYYGWSSRFAEMEFDARPDILHCTYQLPLRAKGACNIYTIHDLVPLRSAIRDARQQAPELQAAAQDRGGGRPYRNGLRKLEAGYCRDARGTRGTGDEYL